ncbi:MAG TPA: tetraacyldisaccharide 4'-kinase [Gammaproteobacteria bacterium]|nr:tetraacyldisaccharide 4'-kinase [Gammaproteobacteria bacterium]
MNTWVKAWYDRHPWLYALTPFAAIYCSAAQIKRYSYRIGLKKTTQFAVPVIVIGNVTVGGTGKTPLVIALAKILLEHGYKPGIVSRGYGGQAATTPQWVTGNSNPLETGDEPLLIARHTLCPLVIAKQRVSAITTLLNHYPCDVILSDDGLQHYAMGRSIEIAVIDGVRRFGNGLCLPAGPLREPLSRLKQVDFKVTQGNPELGEWAMQLLPGTIYNLANPEQKLHPHEHLPPVHAVAGIGNPQRFFTQLEQLGFTVIAHPFPDHYHFQPGDIDFGKNAITIMTEKDAVKCEKFADERHWCLPVTAQCDAGFINLLLEKLGCHPGRK